MVKHVNVLSSHSLMQPDVETISPFISMFPNIYHSPKESLELHRLVHTYISGGCGTRKITLGWHFLLHRGPFALHFKISYPDFLDCTNGLHLDGSSWLEPLYPAPVFFFILCSKDKNTVSSWMLHMECPLPFCIWLSLYLAPRQKQL